MEYAEFEPVEQKTPDYAFNFTREYKILKTDFFTEEMVSRMGAAKMQVLLRDEKSKELYSIGGSFVAGVGGEWGMETMHIKIETAHNVLEKNGDIVFEALELQSERLLLLDVENILTVDTQIPDDFEKMNEAAERFIKTVMRE